jgi:hypothetical protein
MESLIDELENLRFTDGFHLEKFYDSCIITSTGESCIDSETFQNNEVTFDEIPLEVDEISNLGFFRNGLINKVIEEIKNYFPVDELKNLNIFEPSQLPNNFNETEEIKNICTMFGYDKLFFPDLAFYFQTLVDLIKSKPNFTSIKCATFKEFWLSQLRDTSLPWTEDTKLIIETIISLPIGMLH